MKFTRLLAFRLFLIILGVMAVGTAFFTTINIQWQSKQHIETAIKTAGRTSDIIKRSTHYSMLLNRREDIYQIITTTGNEPGIEGIRIYNKLGIVSFSTIEGEVGTRVNMNAEACNACHGSGDIPLAPTPTELTRIFRSPKGYRVLGMITPIYNDPTCSNGPCHAHPKTQTVLGVLDVMLPLSDLDRAMAQSARDQYVSAILLFLAVSLGTGIFVWIVINKPVKQLTKGTEEIMRGNLAHRIPIRSRDELGVLAESFNQMTEELQRARNEIVEWTRTLEERVDEKTKELQRAQRNMIHVEKMASLGQLASTVAHELNNPLEGVLTYAKLLKKKLRSEQIPSPQAEEIQNELSLIADETARCGGIVKNLLLFSKQKVGDMKEEDLRAVVQRSVQLIHHHLQMNNIKLDLKIPDSPMPAFCDSQQLEQALLALEINAVEAMPEGGTLTMRARIIHDQDEVELSISDTGCGIQEKDLPHVFEPFFTTKEGGKGTGLGLAVVYGIIQRHNGNIDVRSRVNAGSTFTLTIPTKSPSVGVAEELHHPVNGHSA